MCICCDFLAPRLSYTLAMTNDLILNYELVQIESDNSLIIGITLPMTTELVLNSEIVQIESDNSMMGGI